jgi:hypothetical protein
MTRGENAVMILSYSISISTVSPRFTDVTFSGTMIKQFAFTMELIAPELCEPVVRT